MFRPDPFRSSGVSRREKTEGGETSAADEEEPLVAEVERRQKRVRVTK